MKSNLKKQFTISKIFLLIGSLWLIIFSILNAAKVYTPYFYGTPTSWEGMAIIGLFYILVPFSVKPGSWSRIWAVLIGAFSLIMVIGFFIAIGMVGVDYHNVWTYVSPLPYIVITIGAGFWLIKGS